MRKINEYFFGEDSVSLHDGLWFYGGLTLFITAVATVVVATW